MKTLPFIAFMILGSAEIAFCQTSKPTLTTELSACFQAGLKESIPQKLHNAYLKPLLENHQTYCEAGSGEPLPKKTLPSVVTLDLEKKPYTKKPSGPPQATLLKLRDSIAHESMVSIAHTYTDIFCGIKWENKEKPSCDGTFVFNQLFENAEFKPGYPGSKHSRFDSAYKDDFTKKLNSLVARVSARAKTENEVMERLNILLLETHQEIAAHRKVPQHSVNPKFESLEEQKAKTLGQGAEKLSDIIDFQKKFAHKISERIAQEPALRIAYTLKFESWLKDALKYELKFPKPSRAPSLNKKTFQSFKLHLLNPIVNGGQFVASNQRVRTTFDPNISNDEILADVQHLIAQRPAASGRALAKLPESKPFVCEALKRIARDLKTKENTQKFIDYSATGLAIASLLSGVGSLAGVAALSAPGVVLGGAASLLDATSNSHAVGNLRDAITFNSAQIASFGTQEVSSQPLKENIEEMNELKERALTNVGVQLGAAALGAVPKQLNKLVLKSPRFTKPRICYVHGDDTVYQIDLFDDELQSVRQITREPEHTEGIATINYSFRDPLQKKKLLLDNVAVAEEYRGQGVQQMLFKELLEANPQVISVYGFFTATNQRVTTLKFIELLKKHPKFIPGELDKTTVYRLYNDNAALFKCCSKFLKHLQTTDPGEIDRLIESAIKESPFWKGLSKFGFNKICENRSNLTNNSGAFFLFISFALCR